MYANKPVEGQRFNSTTLHMIASPVISNRATKLLYTICHSAELTETQTSISFASHVANCHSVLFVPIHT